MPSFCSKKLIEIYFSYYYHNKLYSMIIFRIFKKIKIARKKSKRLILNTLNRKENRKFENLIRRNYILMCAMCALLLNEKKTNKFRFWIHEKISRLILYFPKYYIWHQTLNSSISQILNWYYWLLLLGTNCIWIRIVCPKINRIPLIFFKWNFYFFNQIFILSSVQNNFHNFKLLFFHTLYKNTFIE